MPTFAQPLASQATLTPMRSFGSAEAAGNPSLGTLLESWIVSNIVNHSISSPQAIPWKDRLDDFLKPVEVNSHKKVASSNVQQSKSGWYRFRLKRGTNVLIVTLTDKSLLRLADLAELEQDLAALIEAGHKRLIVNFALVQRMTSWTGKAIANVLTICKKLPGGTIRLCGLTPELAQLFEITNLGRAITIYPDEATALAIPWPDFPELNPLPFDVIMTLCVHSSFPRLAVCTVDSEHRMTTPVKSDSKNTMSKISRGWKLVINQESSQLREVVLNVAKFTIGRDSKCQLRPKSPFVSRFHAVLESRGDQLFLRDLGSTNGTKLNDRLLRGEEVEVFVHDRIQIRSVEFTIERAKQFRDHESVEVRNDKTCYQPDRSPPLIEEVSTKTLDFDMKSENNQRSAPIIEIIEDTLVITPLTPLLDSEDEVDLLRVCLYGLMERTSSLRWVVNLKHVGHVSGPSIGILIAHQLNLMQTGGVLRICEANPRVAIMLEHVKIGLLIDCHETLDDAVLTSWPTR